MKGHYSWRDIPSLLSTSVGRKHLRIATLLRLWPLLQQMATIYRRTALRHTCLVVVIGSLGKTTSARAVSVALGGTDQDVNWYNFKSGVALAVLKTPPWRRFAVIEAGIDGAGQMIRYARITRPDVAVVTCIGSEHNRSLGNLRDTRDEKVKILAGLPPGGVAVLNGDDPNVRWMATQTKNRVITFGLGEANDIRASHLTVNWPEGTHFMLHANGRAYDMTTRLLGRTMVYPVLAAIAVALAKGFSLDRILPPLEALSPTPGRLEPIRLPNSALILRDDFKSSLETIHAALDLFSEIPAARRIVVLGEVSEPPGSQGPIYREIGERIAPIVSRAIFLGGNFQRYAAGVRRGGLPSSSMMDAQRSVLKAIEFLREDLRPGDVVLIKGRDTQRLDRITLALMGRKVCCDIDFCDTRAVRCGTCPKLERGDEKQRMIL
jgi:UDP-N-acetylmuramyl pentapeptide synthase